MTTRPAAAWASALLAILLGGTTRAGAVAGNLDPTFGDAGRAVVSFPAGAAFPEDLVVQPDGRLVLGGTVRRSDGHFAFALARTDANGMLDPSFGEGGLTTTDLADGVQLSKLERLADGRLLGGGFAILNGGFFAVIGRYTENGVLDASFQGSGFFPLQGSTFVGMVVDDLSILALTHKSVNNGIVRSLNLLIGGLSNVAVGQDRPEGLRPRAIAAQAGGRIVFVEAGPEMIVTRLADLRLDPSFGTAGEAVVPADAALGEVTGVLPLPDGRIVVVGHIRDGGDAQAAVVRLLPDATPDASFGDGGRVLLPDAPRFDSVKDVVDGGDGRLIVGVTACDGSACTGYLARLRQDGRFDRAFGADGLVPGLPVVDTLALADEQHLVVLGEKDEQMVLTRHFVSTCGNGALEAGESCDDGNVADGDCCAADCSLEGDGSACVSDDSACTADVCRAGACTHDVPSDAGCAIAASSALVLVDETDDARDRLRLRWSSVTVPADALGDPTAATDVSLCVIDGPPEAREIVAELTAPGGVACGEAPCWRRTDTGFRFRDRTRTHDGIGRLALSFDGANGSILLKARRPGLDLRALAASDRFLVRVVQSDAPGCFESTIVTESSAATRLRAATR